MTFKKQIGKVVFALACLPAIAMAGDNGTVYTQLSTNGIGLGYAVSVSEDWAVRGQYNAFKQSYSGNVGDFGSNSALTLDLNLSSLQLLGDWYPTSTGFRLSGGLVFNDNKLSLTGVGQVNGKTATVNGEVKLSDGVAPYLGIGYSSKPKYAKGFGFVADLGVMFQNPKSTLTATGAGVTQADVDAQNRKVQDALDPLKTMPVLGVGVSYSF